MAIQSLAKSSFLVPRKYNSMLVGNEAFDPSSDFLIQETLISSTTASVTFNVSSIDSTYKHLQIRLTGRSSRADYQDLIAIRINGISTSTYISHTLRGNGATVASGYQNVFSYMFSPASSFDLFAASETTGLYGAAIIDILDYKSTTKNKTFRMLSGVAGGTQAKFINLMSGMEPSTSAAITSITVFPANGSWVAGSRLSIYGSKG